MTSRVSLDGLVLEGSLMNDAPLVNDPLSEILTIRQCDPGRALDRLARAGAELCGRPDAKLLQAELVHELKGPVAALALLTRLVAVFPRYGSAHHLIGRAHAELGNAAAQRESFLLVHALDAILDEALEERDVEQLERSMAPTAVDALSAAPAWARARFTPSAFIWCGRPSREQVASGLDPRAHATLEEVASAVADSNQAPPKRLRVTLYRTNLLASAEDEVELRVNLRGAIQRVFQRLA